MTKYRKKPVAVDAMRFKLPMSISDFAELCFFAGEGATYGNDDRGEHFTIKTLEGDMRADEGDYIIKGVKGEVYPCKPDIFEETYEEVQP